MYPINHESFMHKELKYIKFLKGRLTENVYNAIKMRVSNPVGLYIWWSNEFSYSLILVNIHLQKHHLLIRLSVSFILLCGLKRFISITWMLIIIYLVFKFKHCNTRLIDFLLKKCELKTEMFYWETQLPS